MANPSAISRAFEKLANRKTVGPIEFVVALVALTPFFIWDWGGHYQKQIQIVLLLAFLVAMATSSISASRGVNRPWMRPAIIVVDAITAVVILATVAIIFLRP